MQDTIIFADDTNLFYADGNMKVLFDIMNAELQEISQWFISNKFFHKPSKKDYILLVLPKLYIKGSEPTRYVGVFSG